MKVDEISQSQRRKVLENDRKILSSYLDHAQASADADRGGRFAAIGKTTVTGAGPIQYPRLPLNSPSNQAAMTPQEPSLGYDINAMEPTGEIHEQKASEAIDGERRRGWRRL
jgi:hypothetical protein